MKKQQTKIAEKTIQPTFLDEESEALPLPIFTTKTSLKTLAKTRPSDESASKKQKQKS